MTIEQIIELGNNEHFSKLTCSIIPTIDYWKNLSNKILTDIIADDYNICFEYPVKSIKNATSSYTDIMLISDKACIAIESKWTENIGKDLIIEEFSEIEYQLLHRVVSACSLNKDNCIVTYLIFYISFTQFYGFSLYLDFFQKITQPANFHIIFKWIRC